MALSIGRTLYNLTGRREPGADSSRPGRPWGQLVWLHASEAASSGGLMQLARRLVDDLDVTVLITSQKSLGVTAPRMIEQRPPLDSATDAKVFLDHWKPDLIVMTEGEVRPGRAAGGGGSQAGGVDGRCPHALSDQGA